MLFSLKSTLLALSALVSTALSLPGPALNSTLVSRAGTFANPLNSQKGADPCMRYINGKYFLTATQNTNIQMWSATTVAGLKTATPKVLFSDTTAGRWVVGFI
jgi:hypothetical protein